MGGCRANEKTDENRMNFNHNHRAIEAFTQQSSIFDAYYRPSPIVQYKRKRVRQCLMQFLKPHSNILELNAGTGEDALWLAENGHNLLATDASEGMLRHLQTKVAGQKNIQVQVLDFNDIDLLRPQTFDAIFSNFGGLNCTPHLDKILQKISELLNPGGIIILTIMPPNCMWEWFSVFKLNFNHAFRRWSKGGTPAHIEGVHFTTYYYKPSFVKKHAGSLKHVHTEALCLAVPPEYLRRLAVSYPRFFRITQKAEAIIKSWPLLRNWGDYYVIVLRKD